MKLNPASTQDFDFMEEKSLKELLEKYERCLVGVSYSVLEKTEILFSFSFQLSDFIHLSGIQHIVFGTRYAKALRGLEGIGAIISGILTRGYLQSINGGAYLQYKARIDGMGFLSSDFFADPRLRLFDFDPARCLKRTKLPKGYVFISSDGGNAFFFEAKKGRHDYIPASFFPCKPSIVQNQIEISGFALLKTRL